MKEKPAANNPIISNFPELFLTPNGRKFVSKLLKSLVGELSLEEKPSVESKERNLTRTDHVKILRSKILVCQGNLALPTFPTVEQCLVCLPGNGVKIILNGNPLYLVIDGICVCRHNLPREYAIVSANSLLGKSLMNKKIGESGTYNCNGVEMSFFIEKIDPPSKAKWIFKYNPAEEKMAV